MGAGPSALYAEQQTIVTVRFAGRTEELAPVHNASDEAAIDAAGRYDGGDAEDEDMRAAESG